MFLSTIVNKYIIVILFMFLIGCMLGYLSECLYRRFVSAKKWVNPGFMKGPWLPLYGFGLVLMFAISALMNQILPENITLYNPLGNLFGNIKASGPTVYDLIPISITAIGLILLEFIGGLIFVKGFKIRLWDYTNMRGNILGVICPLFSLIWFVVTIIYYYALNPYIYIMFLNLFDFMFEGGPNGDVINFIFIFILGIAYGIFLIDLISSLGVFKKIVKLARESEGLKHYEKFREQVRQKLNEQKTKVYEILPEAIRQQLEENKKASEINLEKLKDNVSKFKKTINKIILIDPNKKNVDNYDSSGRPKKEE